MEWCRECEARHRQVVVLCLLVVLVCRNLKSDVFGSLSMLLRS